MNKKLRRYVIEYIIIITIGLFISTILHSNSSAFAHEKNKRILFISSYNENFESVPLQIEGIQSVLKPNNINLDIEYMDTKRFATKESEKLFYNLLKYKLSILPTYDAIIVGDDAALEFARDYQEELFKDLPIIFLGINNIKRAEQAVKNQYITGIIEEMSLKENIAIAKTFNPKAKKVVAIVDKTITGLGDEVQFYLTEAKFKDLEFDDINVSEYTFKELEEILENIGQDTILLYMSMYTDKTGENRTISEAVDLIREHTNVPVYRAEVGGVGDGILGGKMVSYQESGKIAAKMALDCLNGTPIESIGMITESPNQFIFDYELIKKFNIDKDLIPKEALLVNKELSFYEANKQLVVTTLIIIVLLIIFTVILSIDNVKRRIIQKALKESNEQLSETFEELSATEEELRAQYQTIQDHVEQIEMLNHKNEFLAQHDYLTKLPNRLNFMSRLKYEIDNNRPGAILLLDLDNFKKINDSLGHSYGDKVLKEVADRLSSIVDEKVFVSRFGGDEFLILISDEICKEEVKRYIHLIKDKFRNSFELMHKENHIQFSIGVSRFPYDCIDVSQLIMNADTAMYKAKLMGKNNYIFYHDDMQEELRDKLEIETILRKALKENGFLLHYQPQVSVNTGDVVSFEALLRLKDYKIPPGKFIGIAEEIGLIVEIGRWVTKEVIEQIARWKQKGMVLKPVSFNYSSEQLRDTTYFAFLEEQLYCNNVEPKYVEIEFTESSLLAETEYTLEFLNRLKNLGVKIALDDFGTGFSSINYLTYIPADKVKLDKSLSDKFLEIDNTNVMDSIISLAHSLDFEITAEGIEEVYQYQRLKDGGCDYIQGYLFSKPLGVNELEAIYDTNLLDQLHM